jgi:hypothetical protein
MINVRIPKVRYHELGRAAVANQRWLSRVLWLVLVVFGVTAIAYFVAPSASLRVVGIASDPSERFLLRTLEAALLAFVVPLWLAAALPSTSTVWRESDSPARRVGRGRRYTYRSLRWQRYTVW